jgi:intracellular sulfur oxidation DsrE/DsrF family protein
LTQIAGAEEENVMRRRDMFRAILAGAGALPGARAAQAAEPARLKVAYHLSDIGKVDFVLGNIKNHYEGVGGNVDIVLVVHGPALASFRAKSASAAVSSRFAGLVRQGLVSQACGNTMHGMDITVADLFDGFQVAEKGGVVRLAELQHLGYVYLRP